MKKKSGCLLISFDFSNDVPISIVGEKTKGQDVKVINAFQNQEAIDIINKLTKPNEGADNNENKH